MKAHSYNYFSLDCLITCRDKTKIHSPNLGENTWNNYRLVVSHCIIHCPCLKTSVNGGASPPAEHIFLLRMLYDATSSQD